MVADKLGGLGDVKNGPVRKGELVADLRTGAERGEVPAALARCRDQDGEDLPRRLDGAFENRFVVGSGIDRCAISAGNSESASAAA